MFHSSAVIDGEKYEMTPQDYVIKHDAVEIDVDGKETMNPDFKQCATRVVAGCCPSSEPVDAVPRLRTPTSSMC